MPPPSLPDDAQLARRLRDRDETAFTQLVDAWSPGMLRLARSFVTTDASAQEVVQEAWIAVVTGIGGFEGRSSMRTWAYRILVNAAKRCAERERHVVPWSSWAADDEVGHQPAVEPSRFQGPSEPYPGHWRGLPQEWPSSETEVLAGEIRGIVGEAVRHLPARQRIVITLRDIEGYTADEVRVILDITAANQRVLLHRARSTVRARLEAYFATSDPVGDDPREVMS